jgi:hypothetical protein
MIQYTHLQERNVTRPVKIVQEKKHVLLKNSSGENVPELSGRNHDSGHMPEVTISAFQS